MPKFYQAARPLPATGRPTAAYTGMASFILRDFDPNAVVSDAADRWLMVANECPHFVEVGTVVVSTEGPRTVGHYHVESIDADRSS
jgi:hypothetical protein